MATVRTGPQLLMPTCPQLLTGLAGLQLLTASRRRLALSCQSRMLTDTRTVYLSCPYIFWFLATGPQQPKDTRTREQYIFRVFR